MKENLQLKKLSINKDGETSILIILMFSVIITFLILPIFAFVFDKALVNLVSQDVVDEIQIVMLNVYPSLSQLDLSVERIVLSDTLKSKINTEISKLETNSMIERIEVMDVLLKKDEFYSIELIIEVALIPSLYREVINIPNKYDFSYTVLLPINN